MTANKAVWVRAAWDKGFSTTTSSTYPFEDVMIGVNGDKVILCRLQSPSERIIFDKKDWRKMMRIIGDELAREAQAATGQKEDTQ